MAEQLGETYAKDLVLIPGQMIKNVQMLLHFYGLETEDDVANLISRFGTTLNGAVDLDEEVGPGKFKSALYYLYLADKEMPGGDSFSRHEGVRVDTEAFFTKRIFGRRGQHPSVDALTKLGSVNGFIERV